MPYVQIWIFRGDMNDFYFKTRIPRVLNDLTVHSDVLVDEGTPVASGTRFVHGWFQFADVLADLQPPRHHERL